MKIPLLCSGLGNVRRGHEVFVRDRLALLRDSLDITLSKGGGELGEHELVIGGLPRYDPLLEHVQVVATPK